MSHDEPTAAPVPRAAIPAPGTLAAPIGAEIQIWWARARFGELDDDLRLTLEADLDPATVARLDRFRRVQDRDRGLAAHSLLRRVLAAVTGGAPAGLVFHTRCAGCGETDHGKPYLDTDGPVPAVGTNLSHSGEAVCVALAAPGVEVGVDVEHRRVVDWATLRRSVFDDSEWAVTDAAPDPERRRTDFWSRKEAAVKASGHGLSLPLRSVVARDEGWGGWTASLPGESGSAVGWDLELAPDVAGAVARHVTGGEGEPLPRPTVHRVVLG